jgi:NitT/TauT family transport system permease protein
MRAKATVRLARVGLIAGALLALEAVVRAGWVSRLVLSAPSTIAVKVWEDLRSGELLAHLRVTALEFGGAFAAVLVLGVALGMLAYRVRPLGRAVEPLLLAFFAAPTILLYPVFLALFGLGSGAVVAMAVVTGTIPLMVNVSAGLRGVERVYVKAGRSLRATPGQLFWKVLLPAATPTIFAGIRLGFTYTFISVVAVEFLIFSGGLGRLVSWRYFVFDTDGVYAGVAAVIVIAAIVNSLVRRAEERVRARWT